MKICYTFKALITFILTSHLKSDVKMTINITKNWSKSEILRKILKDMFSLMDKLHCFENHIFNYSDI